MSAKLTLRRLHCTLFKVRRFFSPCWAQNEIPCGCIRCCSSSSSSSFSFTARHHFLQQFLPFACSNSFNFHVINPNERRRIVVGLSRMIQQGRVRLLVAFSLKFCPYLLVEIMKSLYSRQTAFAFFKVALAFQDDSDNTIKTCCLAAHLLAAEDMRFLAQDVIYHVILKIGSTKSRDLLELMWDGHRSYEPDFSVLDSLMRGFLRAGLVPLALDVLNRMRNVGVLPSPSALTILLKLLLRIGDYGSLWKLFRDLVRNGPPPSVFTFNAIILGFCRKGFLSTGESLLHVMHKFHCEPDVHTYNILIGTYCTRGRTEDALDWRQLMIERDCNPSCWTYNTLVSAMCKEGNLAPARNLFHEMHERGLSPNTVLYNALINGYVKAGQIDQANDLFEEMRRQGVSPDGITFNTLVAGFYRYGREKDAERLLMVFSLSHLVPDHLLPDVSVASLCWAGQLDEALKLLEELLERGLPLTVIAFNSVIAAFGKAGLERKAFDTYKMMVRFGFMPSSSTCCSLLMGLSNKGRLQEAKELLDHMIQKCLPVNKAAFTLLLDAIAAFVDMHMVGLAPNTDTYNILIKGYCKQFDVHSAEALVNKMHVGGWNPDITTYNILMHGLCSCRRINQAIVMLDEIISAGLVPDSATYNIMVNAVCGDMLDRAMILTAKLLKVVFTPNIVTINSLLSHFCKQGLPHKALMWGQRFYEIGFHFDDITSKILDKAYSDLQENMEASVLKGLNGTAALIEGYQLHE
ncbi:hypothetical protein Cgig2_033249 [Carnegiea gigantea]|uniref:Pentatricopeptide repeat-containing protein-mitochondrial domain-containing protein n=1 Tax=Carnegiea gigantea TaxID=171969 RepID=A0A9Q1KVW8_9CARY|nr:hypothetical protein Cgig2_033249 [Carnegiea gigantea]